MVHVDIPDEELVGPPDVVKVVPFRRAVVLAEDARENGPLLSQVLIAFPQELNVQNKGLVEEIWNNIA